MLIQDHVRLHDIRIIVVDKVSPHLIKGLEAHGFKVNYTPGISLRELEEIIGEYHVLVLRGRLRISKKLLEKAVRLKVIARAGIGLDNIDVEAAKSRNIKVVNTPEASVQSVAEHTIMLMLAAARRLREAIRIVEGGEWKKITGMELYGKTLSIIGYGRIGSRVASIAKAIGMRVVAYDICSRALMGARENGVGIIEDLYEALSVGDIVSVHVTLTPKTNHMISYREFESMKKGVIFVNTSRGAVIDTRALLWALNENIVAAAGLDVLENEPPSPLEKRLIRHPRVIVTPHIGAQTLEAQDRIARILVERIVEALSSG